VPERTGRAELREQASRFLAFASPCATPAEAGAVVARLEREYHDATHVAFAWRIGAGDAAISRASDAGEPSGTAGKPIASAIASYGVTDVVVAVVRYFGGTKLGTGGLARAYREAAARALESAGTRKVYDDREVVVTCPYGRLGAVKRLVRPPEIAVVSEEFGQESTITLAVRRSLVASLCATLDDARISYRVTED
jgi:uncharacterized YigZ family protein